MQWLCANVDDQCADWFETHWTGPVQGKYLLGADRAGGVGLVSNNQSLKSGAGGGIVTQALQEVRLSVQYTTHLSKFYIPPPKFYIPPPKFYIPRLKFYIMIPRRKIYVHPHTLRWACHST